MEIRKAEFATEIILSFFVLIITLQNPVKPWVSVATIGLIHSFNVARALEAYKEAQYQQQNLDDYD
jgi:hypothetical protein